MPCFINGKIPGGGGVVAGAPVPVLGDWYSSVTSVVPAAPTTLTLDTVRRGAGFTLAANEVTVNIDGTYLIAADVALERGEAGFDVEVWLELNAVEIAGTRTKADADTDVPSSSAGHTHAIMDLVAGDIIRIRAESDAASASTLADGVRLTIHTPGASPVLSLLDPENVNKSPASAGLSAESARIDHKHDIDTAAAVTVAQANAEGTSTSLARADHVHSHGDQPLGDGLDHAVATDAISGFMSAADKTRLDRIRSVFFLVNANAGTAKGDYNTVSVGQNGSIDFTFAFPENMASIVSVHVHCIPNGNGVNRSFDLDVDYASVGQDYKTHSASAPGTLFSFVANEMTKFELTSLFGSAVGGDIAGVLIDHNVIGSTLNYLGIELEYEV